MIVRCPVCQGDYVATSEQPECPDALWLWHRWLAAYGQVEPASAPVAHTREGHHDQ